MNLGDMALGAFDIVKFVVIGLAIVAFLYFTFKSRYKIAGPNEALVVYGRRVPRAKKGQALTSEEILERARIVVGGGAFVKPIFENYQRMSLEIITLDVDLSEIASRQGIPVRVRAVAQVKIKGTMAAIRTASQGFLSYKEEDIERALRETVAGHVRGIVGNLTIESLTFERAEFQNQVREQAEGDLEALGFEIKSFVVQEIQDARNYLEAIATPKVAEARKQARIAQAEADEISVLREEQAREAQERKTLQVSTSLLEETRALKLREAEVNKEINVKNAEAQKAGELALKQEDIKIATQEVERQREEYKAEVLARADAEKYAIEQEAEAKAAAARALADADAYTLEKQAAARLIAEKAAAEATEAKGLAEAKAEEAVGLAKAAAKEKMAEAQNAFNEAALQLETLNLLPEIAAAIASPMSRAGQTTIISSGDGQGTGAVKMAQDVTQVMALLEQMFPGVDLKRLATALVSKAGSRVDPAAALGVGTPAEAGEQTETSQED